MRRALLVTLSLVCFIVLAAFTVGGEPEGTPRGAAPGTDRPIVPVGVSADGIGGGAIQSCTLRDPNPTNGETRGVAAPGLVSPAGERIGGASAGAPHPSGFRDWIRKIRRFLQWVRSAIDAVLDSTTDGGGNAGPGGTIVNGGLQK